ncbi:MAG TPA: YggS family pyridoxal phosphate-dependent enzyme [Armatimonadaceae bacterium]|nr:YggS family pyridoxal phosphate-dependent enzyme [Armatimonadaceae bacterium]
MSDSSPNPYTPVARSVESVRARMAAAARRAGRLPEDVRLVAVSKNVPPEAVLAAVRVGVQDFGENYVQEARGKIPLVSAQTDVPICWHMIGHLQSNKAKYSVSLFSFIHSVDNLGLAQEIGKQSVKIGKEQAILIEVNLTGADNRAGVSPDRALALAEATARTPGLRLCGLMGMAPQTAEPDLARPYFRQLRTLFDQLSPEHRSILSMGMSADFEAAIEEGSTLVRVGTAIFGTRQGPPQQPS